MVKYNQKGVNPLTLEEYFRLQQKILESMQRSYTFPEKQLKAMTQSIEPYQTVRERLSSAISNMAEPYPFIVHKRLEALNGLNSFLASYQSNIATVSSQASHIWCNQMSASVLQFSDYLKQACSPSVSLSFELANSISSAIAAAQPYLPPKQREECEEVLLPALKEPEKKPFSAESLFRLIEFLMALIPFLFSLLPDPQLEQIIEQNDRLIAIEEERLESEHRQAETLDDLKDIAEALLDAAERLGEQVQTQAEQMDVLADEVEGMNHSVILPGQSGQTHRLEQEPDTKH